MNVSEILQAPDIMFFSASISCGAAWNDGILEFEIYLEFGA